MLTTIFRWVLLRFLPRRLFPLLAAYEAYRLFRRVRAPKARVADVPWGPRAVPDRVPRILPTDTADRSSTTPSSSPATSRPRW